MRPEMWKAHQTSAEDLDRGLNAIDHSAERHSFGHASRFEKPREVMFVARPNTTTLVPNTASVLAPCFLFLVPCSLFLVPCSSFLGTVSCVWCSKRSNVVCLAICGFLYRQATQSDPTVPSQFHGAGDLKHVHGANWSNDHSCQLCSVITRAVVWYLLTLLVVVLGVVSLGSSDRRSCVAGQVPKAAYVRQMCMNLP